MAGSIAPYVAPGGLPSTIRLTDPHGLLGSLCHHVARIHRDVRGNYSAIRRLAGIQTSHGNNGGRRGCIRRHSKRHNRIRSPRPAGGYARQVVIVPRLHQLSQLVERRTQNRQVVQIQIFGKCGVVHICD